ncbi:hypothetical protein Arub01_05940 [Actinomadura rubrobrunea]|uniref:Nucleoside phosphorylase domain-containing protein n=1 Tax=Actinomadura rubrobrunea TaxID=115335 RepID=A0A9W6PPX3_9ACTN|nr:hypothetical protein [Actinomadura rubrobrunea]GLW62350.1 hypothetical protein Arub01_05940 [Actinomadura rubrobrunea]
MTQKHHVEGILNYGGTANVTSSAVGHRPVLHVSTPVTEQDGSTTSQPESRRADVGIITILSVEAQAVVTALGLRKQQIGGLHFYAADVQDRTGPISVVAIRALEQGNRSAMAAYDNLRRHFDPKVVVLVGIGGGFHRDVRVGDVVVATRVVYYDLRKETPMGIRHRGEEREAPADIRHAINAFFTENEPAEFQVEDPAGVTRTMRMLTGPIGSGDAVIADQDAEILSYLAGFNDKILAIDMESGGLSLACHERTAQSGQPHGWAVVRGISDDAGQGKDDSYHRIASWHAAMALRRLLPYLRN